MDQEKILFLQTLIQNGQQQIVLRFLAKYLLQSPQDTEAWIVLSDAVKEPEKKIECLERALRLRPNDLAIAEKLNSFKSPPVSFSKTESFPQVISEEPLKIENSFIPQKTSNTSLAEQKRIFAPKTVSKIQSEISSPQHQAGETTLSIAQYYAGMNKLDHIFFIWCLFWIPVSVLIFLFSPHTIYSIIATLLLFLLILKELRDASKFKKESDFKKITYTKGATGEKKVGEILSTLGEDYQIWHDITCPYGNIDHIVLSKKGNIFLIETKSHSGDIKIKGDRIFKDSKPLEKDFIKQCLHNMGTLRKILYEVTGKEIWVIQFLVFTNAFVTPAKPIKGVTVINAKFLCQAIKENNRKNRGNPDIWEKRDLLTTRLYQETNRAEELRRNNFKLLSNWGRK
jgi:hypothetical protein